MTEKIFTINLRKLTLKAPKWEKSKKSVALIRNFLKRHMKTDEIKLDKSITEEIWKRGSQRPPAKIRIKAYETEEGEKEEKRKVVKAELLGVIHEEVKEKKEEIEKKVEEKVEKELPKTEEKIEEKTK
jgi:large subunit ribosomal protein L31e